jgi:acyl CoA:acetate/3-ketoacid CoA transferase alpha subunit
MRQIVVNQVGVGDSAPIPLDIHGRPEISLQVDTTAATWTLQQTLDNPYTTPLANVLWFDHPDTANMVAQTVDRQGNYAYVPAALRLRVTAGTSAKLTVVQAGIIG